jgi:hypothetical protein
MMNMCACSQLNRNSLAPMHKAQHSHHLCGWFTKRSCFAHWTHLCKSVTRTKSCSEERGTHLVFRYGA